MNEAPFIVVESVSRFKIALGTTVFINRVTISHLRHNCRTGIQSQMLNIHYGFSKADDIIEADKKAEGILDTWLPVILITGLD
ncbi:MAG: hypothetical protein ACOCW1_04590 [Chitinispirillaceae bacterium]